MKEVFKDIPYYEGYYKVSNLGNVKNKMFRILKPNKTEKGYFYVKLSKKGIKRKFKIHQLVAMSFLNHVPNGINIVVDHINNIKTDNNLENLQLISHSENSKKIKKNIKLL